MCYVVLKTQDLHYNIKGSFSVFAYILSNLICFQHEFEMNWKVCKVFWNEFFKNNAINCDDNDDAVKTEDELVYCPDRSKVLQIAKTKQKFLLFSKYDAIVQFYANHVACIIDQYFIKESR